jgi:hypothetical protein
MEPDSNSYAFNHAMACLVYINGQYQKARRYAQRVEAGNLYDGELLYYLASLFGFMGDQANCTRVLNQAVRGGFYNYPFLLRDPFLNSVRDDPEFQKVLALAKKKHEAFKQKYFAE